MPRKVRWGILSTARIGTEKLIPALQQSAHCEVTAIASRTLPKAQQAAQRLGIPRAHGSYEALLADPDVDVIYNPLPNDLHIEWTLQAARAGKHVLCEKPMAIHAADIEALRKVAAGSAGIGAGRVHIMEAFMVRFHPQWQWARDRLRAGDIGTLRTVQVAFSYFNDDPTNIRNAAQQGGGALYDIGCYAIVAGRHLFESLPVRAIALIDRDPRFGTDRTSSGLVDFGEGRRLDFTVSTQTAPYQRVQALGSRGRLELQIPFNAPLDAATLVHLDDGKSLDGRSTLTEVIPPCNMYTLQCDAFARAVRGELALPYGIDDAIVNMRVIDALFRSEASARWEPV
jgi:predicted dehydrogenase